MSAAEGPRVGAVHDGFDIRDDVVGGDRPADMSRLSAYREAAGHLHTAGQHDVMAPLATSITASSRPM